MLIKPVVNDQQLNHLFFLIVLTELCIAFFVYLLFCLFFCFLQIIETGVKSKAKEVLRY